MSGTELSDVDQARIAERYPRRSRIDLVLAILGVVLLVAIAAAFVLSGLVRSNPPVAAMIRSFSTHPQWTLADVVIQRNDPSKEATCFLYAQAANFERVGEMTVSVPAGDEKLTVEHVTIKTVREATAVEVIDCEIVD